MEPRGFNPGAFFVEIVGFLIAQPIASPRSRAGGRRAYFRHGTQAVDGRPREGPCRDLAQTRRRRESVWRIKFDCRLHRLLRVDTLRSLR